MSRAPARRPRQSAATRRRLMTAYGALATVGVAFALVLAVALFIYFGPGPAAKSGETSVLATRSLSGSKSFMGERKTKSGVV